jgi:hypothetical protein
MFSSSGMNLIFGRRNLITVRHTGTRMSMPSNVNTRPAPLDNQTEYCRVFKPASRGSLSCLYLVISLAYTPRLQASACGPYHPKAKTPQCIPQNRKLNSSFVPVICFRRKIHKLILTEFLLFANQVPLIKVSTRDSYICRLEDDLVQAGSVE